MALSHDEIKKFKEVWKKGYGQDITDDQAQEYATSLVNFFTILIEIKAKDLERKEKLKDFPKGFHVNGEGYNCLICYRIISNDETWYDAQGIKCLNCQRALDKKIIPKSICEDSDSWYDLDALHRKCGIHPATARKMIRNGELKARIIKGEGNVPDVYVFLKKENKILQSGKDQT